MKTTFMRFFTFFLAIFLCVIISFGSVSYADAEVTITIDPNTATKTIKVHETYSVTVKAKIATDQLASGGSLATLSITEVAVQPAGVNKADATELSDLSATYVTITAANSETDKGTTTNAGVITAKEQLAIADEAYTIATLTITGKTAGGTTTITFASGVTLAVTVEEADEEGNGSFSSIKFLSSDNETEMAATDTVTITQGKTADVNVQAVLNEALADDKSEVWFWAKTGVTPATGGDDKGETVEPNPESVKKAADEKAIATVKAVKGDKDGSDAKKYTAKLPFTGVTSGEATFTVHAVISADGKEVTDDDWEVGNNTVKIKVLSADAVAKVVKVSADASVSFDAKAKPTYDVTVTISTDKLLGDAKLVVSAESDKTSVVTVADPVVTPNATGTIHSAKITLTGVDSGDAVVTVYAAVSKDNVLGAREFAKINVKVLSGDRTDDNKGTGDNAPKVTVDDVDDVTLSADKLTTTVTVTIKLSGDIPADLLATLDLIDEGTYDEKVLSVDWDAIDTDELKADSNGIYTATVDVKFKLLDPTYSKDITVTLTAEVTSEDANGEDKVIASDDVDITVKIITGTTTPGADEKGYGAALYSGGTNSLRGSTISLALSTDKKTPTKSDDAVISIVISKDFDLGEELDLDIDDEDYEDYWTYTTSRKMTTSVDAGLVYEYTLTFTPNALFTSGTSKDYKVTAIVFKEAKSNYSFDVGSQLSFTVQIVSGDGKTTSDDNGGNGGNATGDYTLSVDKTTDTVARGGSTTITLTLTGDYVVGAEFSYDKAPTYGELELAAAETGMVHKSATNNATFKYTAGYTGGTDTITFRVYSADEEIADSVTVTITVNADEQIATPTEGPQDGSAKYITEMDPSGLFGIAPRIELKNGVVLENIRLYTLEGRQAAFGDKTIKEVAWVEKAGVPSVRQEFGLLGWLMRFFSIRDNKYSYPIERARAIRNSGEVSAADVISNDARADAVEFGAINEDEAIYRVDLDKLRANLESGDNFRVDTSYAAGSEEDDDDQVSKQGPTSDNGTVAGEGEVPDNGGGSKNYLGGSSGGCDAGFGALALTLAAAVILGKKRS